jgi:hypothetical protein
MKKLIKVIAILILLSSCSASWHIRKAQKKDPSLFTTQIIKVIDTVIVEVPKVDTLFKYQFDTVEFTIDSIQVKYFYQTKDSTVYLEVDCPDSEIITNTITKTERVFVKPSLKDRIFSAWWLLVIALVVFIAIQLFNRRIGL